MRLNRLARQKEEKQIFWFWPKHAKLYYYLLQIYIFLKEREREKRKKKRREIACMGALQGSGH